MPNHHLLWYHPIGHQYSILGPRGFASMAGPCRGIQVHKQQPHTPCTATYPLHSCLPTWVVCHDVLGRVPRTLAEDNLWRTHVTGHGVLERATARLVIGAQGQAFPPGWPRCRVPEALLWGIFKHTAILFEKPRL